MKPFTLSYRNLSEALWTRVLENSAPMLRAHGAEFFAQMGSLEELRRKAQNNTGSIPVATQWMLFALAYFVAPEIVAEVGTFIGKSAIAIAKGMDAAGVNGEVHSCDVSNHFDLPKLAKTPVTTYPGSGSTQMFGEMVEDGYAGRVDVLHLDGRLMKEDLALLPQLAAPRAVIVLDDFEGVEKGVMNLMALRNTERFGRHLLVYPPERLLLERFGLPDVSTTALLVPGESLAFAPQ
ncbi:MAG TPA: class I SAM-dependent methyltransferase [Ramlibacter sp.]|uniref:class I SAM-dependent methyltransferase n=1 Tax=Ramlibacter sp. TaxID=1917967 RepID=UPI002C24DEB0|nr:class I SAM-dependent methyltransferase [Ramlibacter sp.]HVZ47062.1 class I SAM-dependent methyltransferase [Ramlibacter sp.]